METNRYAPISQVSQHRSELWNMYEYDDDYETDIDSNKASTYSLSFNFVIAPSLLLSGTSCPFLKSINVGSP